MIRAAVLAAGDGAMLQGILDSIYFKEFQNFELIAVICTSSSDYAMARAVRAEVPAYVVDPELFPTATSHSMAVANKLKDMDIDLVLLAGYNAPLGVIPFQFKNCMIGTIPCLLPAFEDAEPGTDVVASAIERGVRITGATSFFIGEDGGFGSIILQQPIEIYPDDLPDALRARIMEECEWKLMSRSVALFCSGRLVFHGSHVTILEDDNA